MLNQTIFQSQNNSPFGNDLGAEIAAYVALGCSVQFKRRYNLSHQLTMIVQHPDMLYAVFLVYDLLNVEKSLARMKEMRQTFMGLARIEKKII